MHNNFVQVRYHPVCVTPLSEPLEDVEVDEPKTVSYSSDVKVHYLSETSTNQLDNTTRSAVSLISEKEPLQLIDLFFETFLGDSIK